MVTQENPYRSLDPVIKILNSHIILVDFPNNVVPNDPMWICQR